MLNRIARPRRSRSHTLIRSDTLTRRHTVNRVRRLDDARHVAASGGPTNLRNLTNLALLILLLTTQFSCGSQAVKMSGQFWLRAPTDAGFRITPAPPLGAPGAVTRYSVSGVITTHTASSRSDVDFRLSLATQTGKTIEFAYRLGAQRRLPVETGDSLHIWLLHRSHAADAGQDRGLLVYRVDTTNAPPPDRAIGGDGALRAADAPPKPSQTPTRRQTLIAALDQNQVLDPSKLPPALRAVRATDLSAYKESGRFRRNCQDVREQRYFRLIRPDLLDKSSIPKGWSKVRDGRFYAPGSRLLLQHSTRDNFDLVLLSNLAVTRSSCRDTPDLTWSWAAIRSPRQDAPQSTGTTQ